LSEKCKKNQKKVYKNRVKLKKRVNNNRKYYIFYKFVAIF